MRTQIYDYLKKIITYASEIISRLKNKSIVEEWRKHQEEDETYVIRHTIALREEIELLEEFLEENPFHLEALSLFTEDKRGYGNPENLEKIISHYRRIYNTIIYENHRFRNTVSPDTLTEYHETMQELTLLAEKVAQGRL